jgi:hypothetical protein
MRGVHPPVVALLLCVLALPVLVAAATPSHPVDTLTRPAATAGAPSSEPPARATALPGAENGTSWYNTDAVLELAATVVAIGGVAIVVLGRLP